jgi:serine protease Do
MNSLSIAPITEASAAPARERVAAATPPSTRAWLLLGAGLLGLALLALAPAPAQAQANLPDFSELVERVGPAVVNIRTTERPESREPRAGGQGGPGARPLDPSFEEFFRRFGIPMPGQPGPRRGPPGDGEPIQRGVGSGFILSPDGFVMTNAHVVDGADEVLVTLTDKREFKARIVGADRRTDVAVLKIEATGLPTVRIGDVNQLKVGAWVMAIGSPFGLDSSVTAGIVSAKQRDTGELLPFIQTDVAINPGNSGGPLINLRGEVVGINSQIYTRTGSYAGVSFAIPIDEAMRVAEQLRTSGRVIRGRIGVEIGALSKEVAESLGLGQPRGALVRRVEAGGPADKAGIEAGDVITRVDGRVVETSADLPRIITALKPGVRTNLQVLRRGSSRDVAVTVGEFEPEAPSTRAQGPGSAAPGVAKAALGLTVQELSEAQKRELKLKNGVRVAAVEGAAARAGIREGDVILSIDNAEVTDVRQFSSAAERAERANKAVSVLVRREQWVNFVVIRPQNAR